MSKAMIKNGQVDVVILSWNRVENTIATLENILSQEDVDIDVWVIDQGSNDETLRSLKKFIASHSIINLIELHQNFGVAGGRNRGMRLGNGEFIICIDNDAVFDSQTAIKDTVKRFKFDDELAIIGYKIKNFYTNIADRPNWVYARQLMEKKDEEFWATRFCGAGHAIRRSALEKTNYYDEVLFFYWEELDLSYQVINLGYKIIFFPDVCVLHKVDPKQRLNWQGDRYYYLVRNALYLDWKYFRCLQRFMMYSIGYFIKGLFNGIVAQSLRAIGDALKMKRNLKKRRGHLSKKAKEYIYQHDAIYRGSLFDRLKREVMERLD